MADLIAQRYELLGKLGRSRLGEIVKVLDTKTKTVVAMKVFKAQSVSPQALPRIEREVHAVRNLKHPNIVDVIDVGVDNGRVFLTMELLVGGDLRQYIHATRPNGAGGPEGAPPFDEYVHRIAYIFHQVADALGAAHAAGLVHRDVKPESIFVKAGRFPRVKLLEFCDPKGPAGGQDLTVTGTMLGAAWYAPPEQASGRPVTAAADLYSLGCVLFEALAGKPPFAGTTAMDMIVAHMQKPAPIAAELDPRIPQDVSALIFGLMHKEPADRVAPASAVMDILAKY